MVVFRALRRPTHNLRVRSGQMGQGIITDATRCNKTHATAGTTAVCSRRLRRLACVALCSTLLGSFLKRVAHLCRTSNTIRSGEAAPWYTVVLPSTTGKRTGKRGVFRLPHNGMHRISWLRSQPPPPHWPCLPSLSHHPPLRWSH